MKLWIFFSILLLPYQNLQFYFLWVRFPTGLGIFLFTTVSRTILGPTQPTVEWVPGALSLEIKRLGREADYSPSSSVEVKECM
jgi:hypothetical protein